MPGRLEVGAVRQAFAKNMIERQRPGTLHDIPAEHSGPEQVLVLRHSKGLRSILGSAAHQSHQKSALNQRLTSQFPTHRNREFFVVLQGI